MNFLKIYEIFETFMKCLKNYEIFERKLKLKNLTSDITLPLCINGSVLSVIIIMINSDIYT